MKALNPIIMNSHAVFPNEIEIKQLTKQNYRKGANILIEKGAEIVAVKLGKRGCFVTNGKENHLIESYNVEAVDTTGAGDAFCAGFIYGLSKRKDLFECGKLGNFVASKCVSEMGARPGLPSQTDLKDV